MLGISSLGRSQGVPKNFRAPMYRAHCAVIFEIAQLSCCNLQLFAENVSSFGSLPACLRRAMVQKFPEFDQYQLGKLLVCDDKTQ